MFGSSNVMIDKVPLHEPEMYRNVLRILVSNHSVVFNMQNDFVQSISFDSPFFKTNRSIFVGKSFCDVLSAYPEADFSFVYEEGGSLHLLDREQNVLFYFSTENLPFNEYIVNGPPNKKTSSLCIAKLQSIELFK